MPIINPYIFGSGGNPTNGVAADLKAGKTLNNGDGDTVTGTMPQSNYAGGSLTGQGQVATIPAGYYDSARTVTANISNLASGNIRQMVSVGGILGSFPNISTAKPRQINLVNTIERSINPIPGTPIFILAVGGGGGGGSWGSSAFLQGEDGEDTSFDFTFPGNGRISFSLAGGNGGSSIFSSSGGGGGVYGAGIALTSKLFYASIGGGGGGQGLNGRSSDRPGGSSFFGDITAPGGSGGPATANVGGGGGGGAGYISISGTVVGGTPGGAGSTVNNGGTRSFDMLFRSFIGSGGNGGKLNNSNGFAGGGGGGSMLGDGGGIAWNGSNSFWLSTGAGGYGGGGAGGGQTVPYYGNGGGGGGGIIIGFLYSGSLGITFPTSAYYVGKGGQAGGTGQAGSNGAIMIEYLSF